MAVATHEVRAWHNVLGQTDPCASTPASIDLICMLVAYIDAQVVVESGTYRGHTACSIANVFRIRGAGKVYTADIANHAQPNLDAPEMAPVLPFLHYHRGDFLDMLRNVPSPIDLGYIDASDEHNPHLRMQHATAVYARLRPGGLLAIDDTASPDWVGAKMFQLWASREGIHLPQHRGLTLIQRPLP